MIRATTGRNTAKGSHLGDDSERGVERERADAPPRSVKRGRAEAPRLEAVAPEGAAESGQPSPDQARFTAQFRELERDVFRVCRRMLDSSAAADDAVGEVCLRALNALPEYDASRPLRRWLLAIAGNYCIDQLRRRSLETRLFDASEDAPESLSDPGPSPLRQIARAEQQSRVLEAIEALEIRYRLPLLLRYWSDLDYEQIGEVLGVPRGQVGSLLFRARRQLRRSLPQGIEK